MPVDVIGIPTDRRSSPDATPLPPSRLRLWRRPHGTLPCRPGYFPVDSMMLRSTGLHRAIHCIPRRTFALFTFCDITNPHCAGTGGLFELVDGIEDPRQAIPEYLRFLEQIKGWVHGSPMIEHLELVGLYNSF